MAKPAPPLPAPPVPAAPAATPGGAASPDAMRDIVDVVVIVEWWKVALYTALLVAALAAAAWVLWRWWRARRDRLAQPEPPPPPLPPHLWAARELDLALRLIADPDAFCTEVSRILREYLERRFGWNAPDRTTEEFLSAIQRDATLSVEQGRTLGDFLGRCDLVKFARHDPTEEELRGLHAAAMRLVSETTPSAVHGDRPVNATSTPADAP